jgi:surface polysaccharide O-acyltransferase-like enzyme
VNSEDSDQIALLRVLSIMFMMTVHVNPGLSTESAVTTGQFAFVGLVIGDWMGRASVATLSVVSGYLLARSLKLREPNFYRFVFGKARRLLLPMVAWNFFFIALLWGESFLMPGQTHSLFDKPGFGHWLGQGFGLTGQTANGSLFFLRDLFASLCLAFLRPPSGVCRFSRLGSPSC